MSISALIAVGAACVILVGFAWLSVVVSRRVILHDAIDEVGDDDPVRLQEAVRRRLGDAGTAREVEHVLRPVSRVGSSRHA